MGISSSVRGDRVTIRIDEQFDRFSARAFGSAYAGKRPDASYVVDLRGAASIDSSALGQLIRLREHAGGDAADVTLINANAVVMNMLRTANFQNLFTIR